ncbi:hypothetical protein [Muriicola marianensis]|uniref:Glycosyl hydrolase family 88 n=1 Tax=Muriicola marianensis TaxID=1324801 RepID=A0ABQ1QY70_9FLAO|nr:hypothetical protein [Muriicola marianensis]GGD47229.1 hypothetical protein GCM10011361_12500 [Muriicola marianensis]
MNTRNFIIGIIAFSMISCMEDVTTVYEQPLPETVVPDIPEEESAQPAQEANPEKAYEWLIHMQGTNGLVESSEFTNFVSLYDNALAALVFMAEGDLERAEQILDFFNDRLHSEFESNQGGFFQYRDTSGEQGSRIWMGDNAWLLLALNQYHEISQTNRYEILANELETWLRSLQEEDGGLKGGTNEDGSAIPRVTEGIITAFNAVKGFDEFHEKILLFLSEQRWDTEWQVLTTDSENPAYEHALDLYSLGYLILEDFPKSVLHKADRFLTAHTPASRSTMITGYCFDEDRDVVWLEGTAQMALAFQTAQETGKMEEILYDLEGTFLVSEINQEVIGLPYTTNPGTNFGAVALWDHADKAATVSSTSWYLFVKNNFDPFRLEKNKQIPEHLKFWSATEAD